ncbi:hypothetical protein ACIBJC_10405 [Streptomyces sp. NPDC050509]|uniref:hypothetical protein n=1 Tax=Streptomyces sp. NPDC050509 TaxID=3365620 RepID=UPI003787ACE4
MPVAVRFDYEKFKNLYGADWASRLRFVQFPACYLDTPELEECQAYEELETVNDTADGTVTATVDTAGGASTGTVSDDGTATPASFLPAASTPAASTRAGYPGRPAGRPRRRPRLPARPYSASPTPVRARAVPSRRHRSPPAERGRPAAPPAPSPGRTR